MEVKGKRRQKTDFEGILMLVLILLAAVVGGMIIREALPYVESADYQKSLADDVVTEPDPQDIRKDTEAVVSVSSETAESVVSESAPDSYPEEMYRHVDWEALRARNKDIRGWIYIPKTGADYPVLRSKDEEYLHLDADGPERFSGSIFTWTGADNHIGAAHCVLFGHNMIDNSMFGSLDQLAPGDKVYIYTPDDWCREYTVYENVIVSKSDRIFQKGWRDEERKQVLTLATCPGRGSDTSRRIVNTEMTRLKRG